MLQVVVGLFVWLICVGIFLGAVLNSSFIKCAYDFLLLFVDMILSRNNLMVLELSSQAFISGLKEKLPMVAALKHGKRGIIG